MVHNYLHGRVSWEKDQLGRKENQQSKIKGWKGGEMKVRKNWRGGGNNNS